jgi:hypothetical protein
VRGRAKDIVVYVAALASAIGLEARASAATVPWSVGPLPSWTESIDASAQGGDDQDPGTNGQRILLYDRQVRAFGRDVELFTRWSRRVTNEVGLQSGSQINVEFDATYQRLVLHYVKVRRGTEVINQLDPQAIKLVQRETNLNNQIYDGRQSAVLFIKDLRVGDVVEYAFSLVGADPTLGGKFADEVVLGAPFPIGRVFARLVLPGERIVNLSYHGPAHEDASFQPERRVVGGASEFRWDLRSTTTYSPEPDAPPWFDEYPSVHFSEFSSWHDVAVWGQRLFLPTHPVGAPIMEWVRRNLRESSDSNAFVVRATRFVQDEVRYVGIEVGMGRRRPSDPDTTFERRYGDCKDKAALLVSMLRAADIVAWPALVSTTHGLKVHESTPSPDVFDHVIVSAMLEGTTYWLDPTLALQGGGVERYLDSSYDQALVLDERTERLERLTRAPQATPSFSIHDRFQLPAAGSTDEGHLDTERTYERSFADGMRAALRAQTPEQSMQEYLRLFQADYPGIHEVAPIERNDDRATNVVRVVAHFGVPHPWIWRDKEQKFYAAVTARSLQWALPRPASTKRSAPLQILFPFRARQVVDVDLPFDLPPTSEPADAAGPAETLSFNSSYRDRRLTYTYEVVTRANSVGPPDMERHANAVDQARLLMERSITYRPGLAGGDGGGQTNWWMAALAAFVLAIAGIFSWRAYGLQRSIPNTSIGEGTPRSIGGWLILLGLNVLVLPPMLVAESLKGWRIVPSLGKWRALTTPGFETYAPRTAALIVLEVIMQTAFFAYGCMVAATMLKRKRSFPYHFQILITCLAGFGLLDQVLASGISRSADADVSGFTAAFRTVVFAVVWIAYLHRSQRVATTFIV